jgi:hypothetical protein
MLKTDTVHSSETSVISGSLHKLMTQKMTLIWVIPACYSKYNDNKQSDTPQYTYIYFAHDVVYSKVVPNLAQP